MIFELKHNDEKFRVGSKIVTVQFQDTYSWDCLFNSELTVEFKVFADDETWSVDEDILVEEYQPISSESKKLVEMIKKEDQENK